MIRFALFVLVSAILATAQSVVGADPWPKSLPAESAPVPLGVNLEGLADWMHAPMFVDAMKTSRAFGHADQPWSGAGDIKLSSTGDPLQDAGSVIISGLPHMGGVYHFSCIGRTILVPISSDAKIENQAYNTASNRTSADVVVADSATQLMLGFTQTTAGISHIHLIRPGYPPDTNQLFTNEFLAAIKPFTTLRFMDYSNSNGNPTVHWSDRSLPESAQFTIGKGGPWEDAIALANISGKDMWVNIPEEADDDYIRQLALLFKKTLAPGRVVYLENSNEVWNWSFPQATMNQQEAEKEAADPKSLLRVDTGVQWDDPNNKYYWGTKRVAERLIKISEIWQSVYGTDALNKTIRPVLASQIVNPFLIKLQVGYIAKNLGPPSKYIYAIAGAPYFNLDDATLKNASDTVDDVIGALSKSVADYTNKFNPPFIAVAKQYNIKCFAYEGGPDVGQTDQSIDAKVAANRDPRMTGLLVDFLKGWYGDGGSLFMYFDLSSGYGKWGCWGLMDDITQPTPKTEAIVKILSGQVQN